MLFKALLFVLPLSAQFGPHVPDESRSPMSIRPQVTKNCNLAVGGEAWVGRASMKGGSIQVRDLSGTGILSATGLLRVHFANGRYFDYVWRHTSSGFPASSMKITPEETLFAGGLVVPTRIEGIVLGVYFGNGETCGETGANLKEKFQKSIQNVRLDTEQAIGIANSLTPALFETAVRNGLLPSGPYQRDSVASSNSMLRAKLLGPDGKLLPEYKQWLKRWHDSLKPAKQVPQTRSSRQPAR